MKRKIYHINDRTMKYKTLVQAKRQHQYLGIPGTFEARCPQEIIFPNMDAGRVDEYYTTKEGLLINLEEESADITEKTLGKLGKYAIFGAYFYSKRIYSAVIVHKDPKNFPKYYKIAPSLILEIHYYYFPQEELWEKYENIIKKIEQKEELSDNESLDIAFIPKFIAKEYGAQITESLSKLFKHAIIRDKQLKRDVGVLLGGMILKHIDDEEKESELMEDINMKQIENEIRIIAREEFAEELGQAEKEKQKLQLENIKVKNENTKVKNENTKVKNENAKVKNENIELKKGIEQLKNMSNLNSKDAKNLINTLSLIK